MNTTRSAISGTGKSCLVKLIYNAISKTLLDHHKDPERPRVLLLAPISVNTGRITSHSCFGIKLGTKLLGINDESNVLRNRLLEMKCLILDEI